MVDGAFTPYSTVSPLAGTAPVGIPPDEVQRIQSYQTYDQIYWSSPGSFRLVLRGTENRPIYIPSGRIIVETMNRYLCKNFGFLVDPLVGTPASQVNANTALTALFRREAFRQKFNANKRFGLIRGDMIFHVTADPLKPQGSRISINTVDPASYFPVPDERNLDRNVRVHLAEQFLQEDGKTTAIKRQTYERVEGATTILSSVQFYTLQEFSKIDGKPYAATPPTPLPAEITAFPVYHFRNFDEPGNPFGSSEMRGLEILMAGINQSISDEDFTLAMDGLGLYATDGPGPIDEQGNETDWVIGPGRVVENAANFRRVNGAGSVQPYQDHVKSIWSFMQMASGTPDAAIGEIDVQVAESGIARLLKLGPIISKSQEKQEVIEGKMIQMLYDLKAWLKVYEAINIDDVDILPTFDDPLPRDTNGDIDLAVKMVMSDPPIMSAATAREWLATRGVVFAANEFQRIMDERAAMAESAATADPLGDRLGTEAPADQPTEPQTAE